MPEKLVIFRTNPAMAADLKENGQPNPFEIDVTWAEPEVYGRDWARIWRADIVMLVGEKDKEPVARVTTNDGYDPYRKMKVAQHWQLHYKNYFVADTSTPEHAKIYEEMAELLNKGAEK